MIAWFFMLVGWFVLCPPPSHAYLDPGNGSMLLQLLLAGFAGVAVALKMFWRRVVAFFARLKNRSRS